MTKASDAEYERLLDLLDGHRELATKTVSKRLYLPQLEVLRLLRELEKGGLVTHETRGGHMYWRTL